MNDILLVGGLGNQMFIYAFARVMNISLEETVMLTNVLSNGGQQSGYALDHFLINKTDMVMRESNIDSIELNWFCRKLMVGSSLILNFFGFHMPKLLPLIQRIGFPIESLAGFLCQVSYYVPIKYQKRKGNFVYFGFFQSEKYFADYKEMIRKELRVKDAILPENEDLLKEIQMYDSVCVHVRRGDFASPQFRKRHLVCSKGFYERAIERMQKARPMARFFVFSDDIGWTKSNISFPAQTTFVDNSNPAHEDMRLMYSCKHFIISNSSYSWWAQYLGNAPDKIVIAPDRWYNDILDKDMYCMNWLIESCDK